MKRRDFILKSTFAGMTLVAGVNPFVKTLLADGKQQLMLVGAVVLPRILIAADASESEQFAAQELAEYLGKITGKTITVITERAAEATAASPLIVLGHHPRNAELHPEKLELEESVVWAEEHCLRIVGGKLPPLILDKGRVVARDRGTLYGVYHFLNSLGVQWYRPEPWGEHVPEIKVLSLPLGKSTFKPVYKYRNNTNLYRWYPDQTKAQAAMVALWDVRNFVNTNVSMDNKYGGSYVVRTQHNYGSLMPSWKYFKEHPEYFALINGKRNPKGQPCLGNQEVQDVLAEETIARAKENPHFDTISLSPNDGLNYCECDLCRALDDPNLLAKNGGKARLGKVSMTNRVTYVNNLIAARVGKEAPGMKVSWYAYLGTTEVPTKVTSLEPNIYVAPASMAAAYGDYSKLLNDPDSPGNRNFLGVLQGWSKMTPLLTREYWSGGDWYGPIPMWTVLKDRLMQYRKYRVDGIVNETHPSWGTQGDLHYIMARLLWNPEINLQKAMEEYCRNYYGPAAAPMLQYMQTLEKASLNGPAWFFLGRFIDRLYTDQKLVDQLTPLIEQAQELTKGKQPYERRVYGAWAGYEVVRVRALVEKYKKEKNPIAAVSAWDQLGEFIQSDKTGEIFDAGPVMFKSTWRIMSDQAGIGALRKQIASLQANPGAYLLLNLDDNWKFSIDPNEVGLRKGVTKETFSDLSWHTVTTTSDWTSQGFDYHGTAWYRKEFALDKKVQGQKYFLFFGAVDGDAVIYLNGKKVGEHLLGDGYSGWDKDFMIDISDAIKQGNNLIAVQVTKNFAAAGIYKGVSLMQL